MTTRRALSAAVALALTVTTVNAAEIASMATLAVQGAIVPLAREFEQATGHHVTFLFDTGPNLARRLGAGESADVLIAPAAVVEQAITDARVVPGTQATIGRIAVGVAIPRDARRPDISTVDAFKASLLQADAVVYSQGTSGVYIERLFRDLGIADAIKGKTVRLANGGAAMARIAASRANEIGFTMISEVRLFADQGVILVGPLPAAIQNHTSYMAAVMAGSRNRTEAGAFVRHITTPAARRVFAATGWEL